MSKHSPDLPPTNPPVEDRRKFLGLSTSALMAGGLLGGYGMFTHVAGRYLYPARPTKKGWLYVAEIARMKPGDSMSWVSPTGAKIAVARRESGGEQGFIALGSTCPHLGCQVHWEAQNARFFCPCHNGAFDAEGRATAGPPKEANQSLPRFPLKVEEGLLYIEVPLQGVGRETAALERPEGGIPGCRRERPDAGGMEV